MYFRKNIYIYYCQINTNQSFKLFAQQIQDHFYNPFLLK